MSLGVLAQAGFAAATGFTQAHQTATNQLRLVSESMSINYDKLRSQALIGQVAQHEFENGHMMVEGDVVTELAYDDDEILEYCCGAVSSRTYTPTDQLQKYFHLTIDRSTTRYIFRGCMVKSFTISGEAGSENPVQLTLSLIAYHGTTSATAFPSLTTPDDPVLFTHLASVSIADQADAIAGGDEIYISSFTFTCDNNLQTDAKDTSNATNILEPIRAGFRTVTAGFGLARYYTTAPVSSLSGWKSAGTRLQMQLVFTNTDTYTIQIPECKITEGVEFNVGGPGPLEDSVSVECFYNNNNTPMSSVTDQFSITAT